MSFTTRNSDPSYVNGAFFKRSMKLRSTTLQIKKWRSREILELLERIRQPPYAGLVEHLDVRLVETNRLNSEGLPGITVVRLDTHSIPWYDIKWYANTCFTAIASFMERPKPTIEETVTQLANVIPSLTNVSEFTFESWDLKHVRLIEGLLSVAWLSFGSNLTKFSFSGNFSGFVPLSKCKPYLPNLSTLEIELAINPNISEGQARSFAQDIKALEEDVSTFIGIYAPQLESFTFLFWVRMDLTTFFAPLPDFPKLRHVRMDMSYKKPLQDPTTLIRFLTFSTPALRDLQIQFNPYGSAQDKSDQQPLADFLTRLSREPTAFSSLTALDMFPTDLDEGIKVVSIAIERASTTLTRLYIRNRPLQLAELRELAMALARCKMLEILHFHVFEFNLEVIDLIYVNARGLKQLSIFIDESPSIKQSIPLTLKGDLADYSCTHWHLEDLGLWKAEIRVDIALMKAFARSIPSIRGFWGDGHMDHDKPTNVFHQGVDFIKKSICGCVSSANFSD